MTYNTIKMGIAAIIHPLLKNLNYVKRKDELTYIEKLNFVVYLPDPKLGSDEPLVFTRGVDEFSLPVDNCSIDLEELMKKVAYLKPEEAMGISSLVNTANGKRHIGMIDFLTHRNSLKESIQTINELNDEGFLLKTDNSYHFYSTKDLQTEEKFKEYMEKLKGIGSIGLNWPRLQLNQSHALLRISACKYKPTIPHIITYIRQTT